MTDKFIPTYREGAATYRADTCEALERAEEAGAVTLETLVHQPYPGRLLEDDILAGVNSIGYWDARHHQEWGLPWHRNEGLELTCLETGSLPFSIGEEIHPLRPGALTITRPWQPHKLGDPHIPACRLHWIILDVGMRHPHQDWKWPSWLVLTPGDLRELTLFLRGNEQPVWLAGPDLLDCFKLIGKTIAAHPAAIPTSRLTVYINELFLHLLELFRTQQVPLTKSLTNAQRSVELFFANLPDHLAEEWTLESMAESCGLGVTRFVHYCRQVTNRTPMQYLNGIRIQAAAEKLRERPSRSITEIAFECGFSSSQYFATVFRKERGCSPRAFRKLVPEA